MSEAVIANVRPKRRAVSLIEERVRRADQRAIAARYDSAQTTDDNRLYWQGADGLSARAANSPYVRQILRNRARYEVDNNCYAEGMLNTLANYVVGTGPQIQVLTDDSRFNDAVEERWEEWAREIRLAEKLHQMRFAQAQDGESFCIRFANLGRDYPVKLDIRTYEADQFADSAEVQINIKRQDGIVLDDYGNVIGYRLLKQHPGDLLQIQSYGADTIAAATVSHLFRPRRAGQLRGVPEITPALMLYPILRRYTLAVLHAAETAARVAGVIHSTFTPETPDEVEPLDRIELNMNEWLTMPEGWNIQQMKSEQPTTTYPQFKREVVNEIAACLNMPTNIALNDSGGSNFASGKLDHSGFFKRIGIDQERLRDIVVEPTFAAWYREAVLIPGYLPQGPRELPKHAWVFDGQELIDPREANASAVAVSHGLDSITRQHAKRGLQSDDVLRENAKMLGITVEEYQQELRRKFFGNAPAPGNATDDERDDDE